MTGVESGNAAARDHGWRAATLLLWVTLLGAVFANVEIQIEGGAGWAASLPTWRVDGSWLNRLWANKTITGYHVWVFTFMALVFHLPQVMRDAFSLRLEARIVGCIMVFWIVEDFLWFVFNPAFGIARFDRRFIPWHRHWLLGVPVDYVVSLGIGLALVAWSYRRKKGETA